MIGAQDHNLNYGSLAIWKNLKIIVPKCKQPKAKNKKISVTQILANFITLNILRILGFGYFGSIFK